MTTLNSFSSEKQLTASEETLASTTATEKKYIGMMTLTNTSTSNVLVTLWRIGSTKEGTEGVGGNWIFSEKITANNTMIIREVMGQVLDFGMKISGKASVADVVNVDISGTTE